MIVQCIVLSYTILPTISFECFLCIRRLFFLLVELELCPTKYTKDSLDTCIDQARRSVKSSSVLSKQQINLIERMYHINYRLIFNESLNAQEFRTPEPTLTIFERLKEQTIDIKKRLEILCTIAMEITSKEIDSKVYLLEKIFSNCIYYSLQTIDCYLQRDIFELYKCLSLVFHNMSVE